MRAAAQRVVEFFENLTPHSVARFGEYYTDDAYFKDPFNEVRGLAEVQRIFSHMYEVLDEPRFVIRAHLVDGDQCFLTWVFCFRFKSFKSQEVQIIHGASHLKFAPDGRIEHHRDYWDAAEELYEKLPVVGSLMRWLRRRANS
ncbi:MAG: nuclear transport factor 2 family protein [Gammaproteobacteria bacterium]|nr:nuclear transport factor 2 family protein [Gammaproteobacteria bacterium]MBU0785597.1 nuclear transport factor 2 family protein [Gammaproteobacteria bacterium]MBU0816886.1 nuclear transport factor 2 family protein [Gammaproteobacteria bacterium]MBU1787050.1 nuclear transport factor 2 family protein [Gammaproteobacteria bacterium]